MSKIIILTLFFYAKYIFSVEIPNLPVYDLQDERYTLHKEISNFKSEKLLVINFTNTNCKPCKIEVPKLIETFTKLESKGLAFWIIFIGDNNESIEPMLKDMNIPPNVKIFKDTLEISYKRLNFSGVPATFLVDTKKELVFTSIGYTANKLKKLEQKIEEQLK